MISRKRTLPKRAGVVKKRPRKKPAARVFTYVRGKETVSTTSRKSGKP